MKKHMNILVTGGAGFIGSHFIKYMLSKYPGCLIVNYDCLTYAGCLEMLQEIKGSSKHIFVKGSINDTVLLQLPPSCIEFVADRPGHDYRYAIDSSKLKNSLGWRPKISFTEGLKETITGIFKMRTGGNRLNRFDLVLFF